MLNVEKIKKGIVIDHIKPGCGKKIFDEMNLGSLEFTVAFLRNVPSKKYGKKDLIKIENVVDLDMMRLGLIDPELTINIIENEEIVKKVELTLPQRVQGILKCKNPRCISTFEDVGAIEFTLVDADKKQYKCEYCDSSTSI